MKEISVHDFCRQLKCNYNGEEYSVRDNGAVLRHARIGTSPRKNDEKWTFGRPNRQKGYMQIASIGVHRIVATAFHGCPPKPEYVVDHIDINRRNNRPENLRWVTRVENAILNPITAKKIIEICGTIEAFLEDPSRIGQGLKSTSYDWMRTVSREEGRVSLERMLTWSKRGKPTRGGTLGEWIFQHKEINHLGNLPVELLIMSLTKGAAQRNWQTPAEFPCCPLENVDEPIKSYALNLKPGVIFSRNHQKQNSIVKIALSEDQSSVWVICEQEGVKPWSLSQISFEGNLYVHTSLGTFFSREGVEKQFCLSQGLEWTGPDSIDDNC